jgi:hypothetical protein
VAQKKGDALDIRDKYTVAAKSASLKSESEKLRINTTLRLIIILTFAFDNALSPYTRNQYRILELGFFLNIRYQKNTKLLAS